MGYLLSSHKVKSQPDEPLKISVSIQFLSYVLTELAELNPDYPNVTVCLKAFPEVAWVDIDTDFDIKDK